MEMVEVCKMEVLPVDLIAHCFLLFSSFKDLARASMVCRKWREAAKQCVARKEALSFAGWKMDDSSLGRIVQGAYSLKELDISRACWGCRITDVGLYRISLAKCCSNLTSVSMWGITGITDKGVKQLVLILWSCRHVTESGLFALIQGCPKLESINVWGVRASLDCYMGLLAINPHLNIKPRGIHLQAGNIPRWPPVQ